MPVPTMHLALFGATGGTGSLVLQQALDAGHRVTALVRTPGKLAVSHPNLKVVQGSVLDRECVDQTIQDVDAVICTLGAPPSSKERLRERGTQVVVDAMQAAGVRRLVVQSSHGIGETSHELPWLMRWVIVPLYLKKVFADHERQEAVVGASELDWTLVRPPHLSNGNAADALTFGTTYDPKQMTMSIARTDAARFLLEQGTTQAYIRQTIIVSAATAQAAASAEKGAIIEVAA